MTAQKELNKETNKTLLNTTMTTDGNCSKTGRMFSDFKKYIIRASPTLRDLLFGNKRGILESKVIIQIWFLLEHRNKLRNYSYRVIEWNFQWQYYQEQMVRVLYTYFNTQRKIQTFFFETLEGSGNPQNVRFSETFAKHDFIEISPILPIVFLTHFKGPTIIKCLSQTLQTFRPDLKYFLRNDTLLRE